MSTKRIFQIGIAAGVLLALAAGVYLGAQARKQENPFYNFAVVEPGVLYRSAQPRRGDIERIHQAYGIQTLLSLRGREDPEVLDYARRHGLDWIILQMKADLPPTAEQAELFFRLVDGKPIDLNRYAGVIRSCSRRGPGEVVFGRPVLMHCEGGADRTGVMTALYRIENQGWTIEEAKQDMLGHFHFWWAHPRLFHFLDQYHPRPGER